MIADQSNRRRPTWFVRTVTLLFAVVVLTFSVKGLRAEEEKVPPTPADPAAATVEGRLKRVESMLGELKLLVKMMDPKNRETKTVSPPFYVVKIDGGIASGSERDLIERGHIKKGDLEKMNAVPVSLGGTPEGRIANTSPVEARLRRLESSIMDVARHVKLLIKEKEGN